MTTEPTKSEKDTNRATIVDIDMLTGSSLYAQTKNILTSILIIVNYYSLYTVSLKKNKHLAFFSNSPVQSLLRVILQT